MMEKAAKEEEEDKKEDKLECIGRTALTSLLAVSAQSISVSLERKQSLLVSPSSHCGGIAEVFVLTPLFSALLPPSWQQE